MDTFPVLVIKDVLGNLYHMRMDKPFERYISQLLTNLAYANAQTSPREIANLWIEDMTLEEYKAINGSVVIPAKTPHFVTSEPERQ